MEGQFLKKNNLYKIKECGRILHGTFQIVKRCKIQITYYLSFFKFNNVKKDYFGLMNKIIVLTIELWSAL